MGLTCPLLFSIFILTTKYEGLLTPWMPLDDGLSSTDDYSHVTVLPPRQVVGLLIDHYRRLDSYLVTPSGEADFSSSSLFADAPLDPATGEAQPPTDWDPDDATKWLPNTLCGGLRVASKTSISSAAGIRKSREQPDFRRDEFLRKRAGYWADVVESLVRAEAGL